ncbi:MAG: arylesterase, partial [Micavibrio aeruginosavorus]
TLEQRLKTDGFNIRIQNEGLSVDTTAGGLSRLPAAIAGEPKPRLVIVALGANDMVHRLDAEQAKKNLSAILQALKDQKIPVFLIGIRNPLGYGPFMKGPFPALFQDLAKEFDVPFYPYMLKDVAMIPELNQADGSHPNEKGVAIMVKNIAPSIEDALKKD